MKVVTVRSAALVGVEAHAVDVEVALTNQLPGLKTVGLPDAALREGKERIPLALKHQALLSYRPSVIVNLAPAELRKSGARYELAIALGILIACDKVPAAAAERLLVVGELSLHGAVRPVRGALAMAWLARSLERPIVVPRENAREAALVDGVEVFAIDTLRGLVEGLRGDAELAPYVAAATAGEEASDRPAADMSEVRGQGHARRAAEVATAGGHNLLLVGPPGSGKTMIARRLPGILPPPSEAEAIEATRIWSAAGLLGPDAGLLRRRPFRAPHHTISASGLIGGYTPPRPGELSLAHNGVLFLDEMAEFSRRSLEALREPLEEGRVRIVRGGVICEFPARTMLVAATNPCPCGHAGDPGRTCRCPPGVIDRYRGRLSGPLLDRIDLHVDVPRLEVGELVDRSLAESSRAIAARVRRARSRQTRRAGRTGAPTNAELSEAAVRDEVGVDAETRRALVSAVERLALSPRAYFRVLKVARTIADLDGEAKVALPHVLEAIGYRSLDRSPV